jgi:hypothetical protein
MDGIYQGDTDLSRVTGKVDRAMAGDPLARQSAVAERAGARSSTGRPGTRTYRGQSEGRKGP